MNIAQRLYEGVDLGEAGTMALITYMRTDSVRISDEARDAAKDFIESAWGQGVLPAQGTVFQIQGRSPGRSRGGPARGRFHHARQHQTPGSPRTVPALPPDLDPFSRLPDGRARVQDTVVLALCDKIQFRGPRVNV